MVYAIDTRFPTATIASLVVLYPESLSMNGQLSICLGSTTAKGVVPLGDNTLRKSTMTWTTLDKDGSSRSKFSPVKIDQMPLMTDMFMVLSKSMGSPNDIIDVISYITICTICLCSTTNLWPRIGYPNRYHSRKVVAIKMWSLFQVRLNLDFS